MPGASTTPDVLARPTSSTRIFVTLTLAEAAALARLDPGTAHYAIQGLAKIQTAVEAAILAPTGPQGAIVEPPLRANAYRPPVPSQPTVTPTRGRHASAAARRPTVAQKASVDDDYVPCRDEANGIWK